MVRTPPPLTHTNTNHTDINNEEIVCCPNIQKCHRILVDTTIKNGMSHLDLHWSVLYPI